MILGMQSREGGAIVAISMTKQLCLAVHIFCARCASIFYVVSKLSFALHGDLTNLTEHVSSGQQTGYCRLLKQEHPATTTADSKLQLKEYY